MTGGTGDAGRINRDLARAAAVDMPIAEAVAAVVSGRLGVDDAVAALMNRPLKAER